MMTTLSRLTLLFCLLLPLQGWADTYSYPNTRNPVFSVDIPSNWRVSVEEGLLHAGPPDESVYLGFWALDQWVDQVGDAVDQVVGQLVNNFRMQTEEETEINGLPFYFIEGAGNYVEDGSWVDVSIAVFSPNGQTFCVMLYFGPPVATQTHENTLVGIVRTIRAGR